MATQSPCGDDHVHIIEARIAQHPGYKEHIKLTALRRTIEDVYMPNFEELVGMLDKVAKDPDLAFEMVQNVREPIVREELQAKMIRALHNYLASVKSLADHARAIMRKRTGSIGGEYDLRKTNLVSRPDFRFIVDLRNYVLHRSLPGLAHSVALRNVNTPQARMKSEVELNVAPLLRWDGWTAPARRFLEQHDEVVPLGPTVKAVGWGVYELNSWLYNTLFEQNRRPLAEVNELIVERNAAWAGVDIETARRMSDGGN